MASFQRGLHGFHIVLVANLPLLAGHGQLVGLTLLMEALHFVPEMHQVSLCAIGARPTRPVGCALHKNPFSCCLLQRHAILPSGESLVLIPGHEACHEFAPDPGASLVLKDVLNEVEPRSELALAQARAKRFDFQNELLPQLLCVLLAILFHFGDPLLLLWPHEPSPGA